MGAASQELRELLAVEGARGHPPSQHKEVGLTILNCLQSGNKVKIDQKWSEKRA